MLFLRYVGTDPQAFAGSFDRLRIVDGQPIPAGKRGFLFSKIVYEDQLKLKTAHRLDKIKDARISADCASPRIPSCSVSFTRTAARCARSCFSSTPRRRRSSVPGCDGELGSQEADVGKLLAELFKTDDQNFDRRYAFFYGELAPSLEPVPGAGGRHAHHQGVHQERLCPVGQAARLRHLRLPGPGEVGAGRRPQRHGSGLVPGAVRVFDRRERKGDPGAQAASGAHDVDRDKAEAELFGSQAKEAEGSPGEGRTIEASVTPGIRAAAGESTGARLRREDLVDRVYDRKELERGVVLNAAVILDDPRKLDQAIKDIEAAGKEAGLPLRAIFVQKAPPGWSAQFVTMMRGVLFTAC